MTTGGKEAPPDLEARRRAFRAALALAGETATRFADQLGVTLNHMNCVLRGERHSKRILEAVDTFVRTQKH